MQQRRLIGQRSGPSNGFIMSPTNVVTMILNIIILIGVLVLVALIFSRVNSIQQNGICTVDCEPNATKMVNVKNFPELQQVNVTNIDDIQIEFPQLQQVNVTNIDDIQIHMNNVTVEAMFPPLQQVNVTNFPESSFPELQQVNVTNFPEPVPLENITLNPNQRVISQGVTDSGMPHDLRVTTGGHIEAVLRGPVSSFDNVLMDSLWPVFQATAVYGVNPSQVSPTEFGSGLITENNAAFQIMSGTTPGSYATLQSRKRLVYRSGQGSRIMLSAKFSEPQLNTLQLVGMGTPENGVFFAYVNTLFGIFYVHRGIREVQLLTITQGSSTAEDVVVVLENIPHLVPVTASGNIQRTVYEISSFVYQGWKAEPFKDGVRFIKDRAIDGVGNFSLSATTAVGTFTEIYPGKLPVQTFIPQNTWNQDQLNGSGESGITLNPQLFNVYMISLQYLGAGAVRFFIEGVPHNQAENQMIPVHTLQIPNTLTQTSFSNPNFPAAVLANTFGGANVTVESGCMAGFVEGMVRYRGNRYAFDRTLTSTVNAAACYALISIRNARVVNNRTNQGVITLADVSGAIKHTQPATLFLYRSNELFQHDLQGNPNFQPVNIFSGVLLDKSATTFTPLSSSQLIWSGELAETGNIGENFLASDLESISLEPGETITLCAKTNQNTAAYVTASMSVREDN